MNEYDARLLDAGIVTGPIGDPVVEEKIHELAQADEDRGLREAEAYDEAPVAPVTAKGSHVPPIPSGQGEYYGRTSAGELIGPYDSQEMLDRELAEANRELADDGPWS